MKAYFMMVVGAAVLSALASVMSPDKWRKYIQLVTGIVILCCIMTPVSGILRNSAVFSVPEISTDTKYDEGMHSELIINELRDRIEKDIEARMEKEYGVQIKAEVEIELNEDNEIEGVTYINISEGHLSETAKRELSKIYGVDRVYEKQ